MSKKNKADKQIKKLLAGTTIAVLRSKTYANGQQVISGSKPCKHCCMFMKQFGIKAVYYSNDEGQMVREKISEIKSTHVSLARRAAL
jgi:deoxycytidylate deaminase